MREPGGGGGVSSSWPVPSCSAMSRADNGGSVIIFSKSRRWVRHEDEHHDDPEQLRALSNRLVCMRVERRGTPALDRCARDDGGGGLARAPCSPAKGGAHTDIPIARLGTRLR